MTSAGTQPEWTQDLMQHDGATRRLGQNAPEQRSLGVSESFWTQNPQPRNHSESGLRVNDISACAPTQYDHIRPT